MSDPRVQFGETGVELVRELNRSKWLPRYNEAGVRKVANEVNDLNEIVAKTLEYVSLFLPPPPASSFVSCLLPMCMFLLFPPFSILFLTHLFSSSFPLFSFVS